MLNKLHCFHSAFLIFYSYTLLFLQSKPTHRTPPLQYWQQLHNYTTKTNSRMENPSSKKPIKGKVIN